jgi:hypothetical protein
MVEKGPASWLAGTDCSRLIPRNIENEAVTRVGRVVNVAAAVQNTEIGGARSVKERSETLRPTKRYRAILRFLFPFLVLCGFKVHISLEVLYHYPRIHLLGNRRRKI